MASRLSRNTSCLGESGLEMFNGFGSPGLYAANVAAIAASKADFLFSAVNGLSWPVADPPLGGAAADPPGPVDVFCSAATRSYKMINLAK